MNKSNKVFLSIIKVIGKLLSIILLVVSFINIFLLALSQIIPQIITKQDIKYFIPNLINNNYISDYISSIYLGEFLVVGIVIAIIIILLIMLFSWSIKTTLLYNGYPFLLVGMSLLIFKNYYPLLTKLLSETQLPIFEENLDKTYKLTASIGIVYIAIGVLLLGGGIYLAIKKAKKDGFLKIELKKEIKEKKIVPEGLVEQVIEKPEITEMLVIEEKKEPVAESPIKEEIIPPIEMEDMKPIVIKSNKKEQSIETLDIKEDLSTNSDNLEQLESKPQIEEFTLIPESESEIEEFTLIPENEPKIKEFSILPDNEQVTEEKSVESDPIEIIEAPSILPSNEEIIKEAPLIISDDETVIEELVILPDPIAENKTTLSEETAPSIITDESVEELDSLIKEAPVFDNVKTDIKEEIIKEAPTIISDNETAIEELVASPINESVEGKTSSIITNESLEEPNSLIKEQQVDDVKTNIKEEIKEAEIKNVYCEECGIVNDIDSLYCANCGKTIK